MCRRTFLGVLTGFLLASTVAFMYASDNVMLLSKKFFGNKEQEKVYSSDMVKCEVFKNCNTLSFSSAKDFIGSLCGIVDIDSITELYKTASVSMNKDVFLDFYESKNGMITIATYPDDTVAYCKFKGVSKAIEAKIKELMNPESNKTDYRYKVINNGFILEPETLC